MINQWCVVQPTIKYRLVFSPLTIFLSIFHVRDALLSYWMIQNFLVAQNLLYIHLAYELSLWKNFRTSFIAVASSNLLMPNPPSDFVLQIEFYAILWVFNFQIKLAQMEFMLVITVVGNWQNCIQKFITGHITALNSSILMLMFNCLLDQWLIFLFILFIMGPKSLALSLLWDRGMLRDKMGRQTLFTLMVSIVSDLLFAPLLNIRLDFFSLNRKPCIKF